MPLPAHSRRDGLDFGDRAPFHGLAAAQDAQKPLLDHDFRGIRKMHSCDAQMLVV